MLVLSLASTNVVGIVDETVEFTYSGESFPTKEHLPIPLMYRVVPDLLLLTSEVPRSI